MDPGRRNYGGLYGGSRSFYLGLRGTRLLGLCKCLSIFFLWKGRKYYDDDDDEDDDEDEELRWLSFIENWMDGLKF